MWSFAILLWELVTREVPFADLSNMEIGMKVSRAAVGWFDFNWEAVTGLRIHLLLVALWHPLEYLFYNTKCLVFFGFQVALEGLRPTIPPGISPHICKLMKICMNEDPAKRPKFDMIVPILEKMQDKWNTFCALLYWTWYLTPNGGVVLTSIALNSYYAAAFNATVASASEMNSAAVTPFYIALFHCSMCYEDVFVFFCHWNHMDEYNHLQHVRLNNL